MKINPLIKYNFTLYENKKANKTNDNQVNNKYSSIPDNNLMHGFNDYMLFFTGERVDKGLNRFYAENKDRMPLTVKRFVEPLSNREIYTPLEAQQLAFRKLENAKTVDDIKEAYPDEPLFQDLKSADSMKSNRGILNSLRQNKELLDLYGVGILENNEDFTVYLVKKIFLEAKTIDEINEDLEQDLQKDFKVDFKSDNPDSRYIYATTLGALGIKLPNRQYQTSLRYTRDGYSDAVGAKITKSLHDFWNNLSVEDRTARAKKSVENFENWWQRLTVDEKLEMIADTDPETAMLKAFKREKRKQKAAESAAKPEQGIEVQEKPKHEKVKSKLGEDKLFILWATHNLKNYEQSLTEADKDTLHLKRMARLVQRWQKMSPTERTDYISKMKSGSEPVRYAMIDAWNHSFDIIKDLSAHLKNYQVYKPVNMLYSTEEFSQFQSNIMSEFWETHPEHAEKLGYNIRQSQINVDLAIKRGNFEELKKQIDRDKNDRIKRLNILKSEEAARRAELEAEAMPKVVEDDYKTEFKKAYDEHVFGQLKSLPKNYYNDMYKELLEILPEDTIRVWTRNLKGEPISPEYSEQIKNILQETTPEISRINRALEAAMAEVLYATTNSPEVYELSNSDVKMVMYHVERGESPIKIVSHKNQKEYTFEIKNKYKSSYAVRINELYENFKKDLPDEKVEDIINYNFLPSFNMKSDNVPASLRKDLAEYIKTYGRSASILFSNKTAYSKAVKDAFAGKFIANMPQELRSNDLISKNLYGFVDFNNDMKHAKMLFNRKFPFLPTEFVDLYMDELGVSMKFKNDKSITIQDYMRRVCVKRNDVQSHSKVLQIPKSPIQRFETKLKMLAMEQALADSLYEATGCEGVYKMGFEMLCDKVELLSLVKKFPSEGSYGLGIDNEKIDFTPKKRLNITAIQKSYNNYVKEINAWLKEEGNITQDSDFEELVYILNPDEGKMDKDMNIARRIASYGLKVDHFSIYPPEP